MKKAIMLALALAVLATGVAWAQVGSVTGTVVDRVGNPVEGARVSLHQDEVCVGYVLTDAAGVFLFTDVEPGTYTLRASKKRIGTVAIAVEVVADELIDVGVLQLAGKFVYGPAPREPYGPPQE